MSIPLQRYIDQIEGGRIMSNVQKIRRNKITLEMEIGGQVQELDIKFSLNSYALMEERYGSIDNALDAVKGKSMVALRFMIWAGIQHNSGEITETQIGNAMDMRDMDYYMDKVSEAMGSDGPTQEKEIPNS